MRLIPKHRQHHRKIPRIAISEEEIAADLRYPARRARAGNVAGQHRRRR